MGFCSSIGVREHVLTPKANADFDFSSSSCWPRHFRFNSLRSDKSVHTPFWGGRCEKEESRAGEEEGIHSFSGVGGGEEGQVEEFWWKVGQQEYIGPV